MENSGSPSGGPPNYPPPLEKSNSAEYIHVDIKRKSVASHDEEAKLSPDYQPPLFPPPEIKYEPEKVKVSFGQKHRRFIKVCRYIFVIVLVEGLLAIPVVIYDKDSEGFDWDTDYAHNFMYWFFLWLCIAWGSFAVSNIGANLLPHVFRWIASYINPGHRKYWRILRFMRKAFTMLGGSIGSIVSFNVLIVLNGRVLYLSKIDPADKKFDWSDIVDELLTLLLMWSVMFTIEKCAMLYITLHYHYRSEENAIMKSKRVRKALTVMYEASTKLHRPFDKQFLSEDAMIRDFFGTKDEVHAEANQFLAKVGAKGSSAISKVGRMINNNNRSRWFKTASNLAIVDRALEHQRTAAALAKRIWMSLVPQGSQFLTANDLVEVLGAYRRVEAEEAFAMLDDNEHGNLTLQEMVLTVLEVSRQRNAIYQGMHDINRVINSLDWVFIVIITATLAIFALVTHVPGLKGLKDAAGLAAFGLTWGIGRTLYELLNGLIFILFKHAYDVGDRVEVYNAPATIRTSLIVKRISILFTIFERLDNGKLLQMSNDRLNAKRVENVTRSGLCHEDVSVFVDFNTTFTDIEILRAELNHFLASPENSRDYKPECTLSVNSLFEMQKMELKCTFTHKSNWSNEQLRAARSSKFLCALVAIVRKIQLAKPGTLSVAGPLKDLKDSQFEPNREDEAYHNLTLLPVADAKEKERANIKDIATGSEIVSWIGTSNTGIRSRAVYNANRVYGGS